MIGVAAFPIVGPNPSPPQRALIGFSLLLLVALAVTLLLGQIDTRTLDGIGVWVKPAKFQAAIALHCLTWAVLLNLVERVAHERRLLRVSAWLVIGCNAFELFWITWQAAHGRASHYNYGSVLASVMYGLMGVGAVTIIAMNLPLAWAIRRWPAAELRPPLPLSAVLGLLLSFLLTLALGLYMSQQPGHAVGTIGGHAPLFGWNRSGGDLRVSHFFAIHAMQLVPLAGLFAASLAPRLRIPAVLLAAVLVTAASVASFLQALAGEPFLAAWLS